MTRGIRALLLTAALIPAALTLSACGGGGSDDAGGGDGLVSEAQLAALQACLGDGIEELRRVLGGFEPLFAVAGNPAAAAALGITWDPVAGEPNTYDFAVPVDLDGDDLPDLTLEGRAAFSADPAGGLGVGDSADVTWTIANSATLGGEADLTIELAASGIFLWGTAEIAPTASDCIVTIEAAEGDPLLVTIDGVWPPVLAQQAGGGANLNGNAQVTVQGGGNTLTGNANLNSASGTILVTNASVNGTPASGFTLGGATYAIDDWVGTWTIPLTCQADIQNPVPSERTMILVITRVTNSSDALNVDVDESLIGIDFAYEVTFDPASPDSIDFFVDHTDVRNIDFIEEGTYTLSGSGANRKLAVDGAYRTTAPGSTYPPGTCVGQSE
jgi:hypothetical protein